MTKIEEEPAMAQGYAIWQGAELLIELKPSGQTRCKIIGESEDSLRVRRLDGSDSVIPKSSIRQILILAPWTGPGRTRRIFF